ELAADVPRADDRDLLPGAHGRRIYHRGPAVSRASTDRRDRPDDARGARGPVVPRGYGSSHDHAGSTPTQSTPVGIHEHAEWPPAPVVAASAPPWPPSPPRPPSPPP